MHGGVAIVDNHDHEYQRCALAVNMIRRLHPTAEGTLLIIPARGVLTNDPMRNAMALVHRVAGEPPAHGNVIERRRFFQLSACDNYKRPRQFQLPGHTDGKRNQRGGDGEDHDHAVNDAPVASNDTQHGPRCGSDYARKGGMAKPF